MALYNKNPIASFAGRMKGRMDKLSSAAAKAVTKIETLQGGISGVKPVVEANLCCLNERCFAVEGGSISLTDSLNPEVHPGSKDSPGTGAEEGFPQVHFLLLFYLLTPYVQKVADFPTYFLHLFWEPPSTDMIDL